MFALPLTIYKLIANQIKCHMFDLKNEDQGQGGKKQNLHHLTTNIRFYIGEFFQNVILSGDIFTQKITQRATRVLAKDKIGKADLPKHSIKSYLHNEVCVTGCHVLSSKLYFSIQS